MTTFKYGRSKDDYSKPKLDLTSLVTQADFSMVPATADPLAPFVPKLLMLGNGPDPMFGPDFSGAGDCEVARVANNRLLLTGKYPVPEGPELVNWLMTLYKTQAKDFNPNGDPNVNGPGSDADTGMSSDVLLDHLHKVGTPDGVKVVAYGTIDPKNVQAVERAIAVSGGSVWFDVLVQRGNQDEFNARKPWTNTGEDPEGGHAILGGGYIPNRRAATWADEVTLSDSFWQGVVNGEPLVERVYLVIWPEHCTTSFLASESAAMLAAQFESLVGKPLVWPTPVPTPAPTPSPVPTPDVSAADAALATALHRYLSHRHTGVVTAPMAEAGQTWLTIKGL